MVTDNIYSLIRNYLLCRDIGYVIFTYGFHGERKAIFDEVLHRLERGLEDDIARGFIVVKETSHYTVEICVMGVRKEYHRLGIGSKLFEAFYQKAGFRELECMDGLWDEANLCQVYVMAVR